MTSRNIWLIIGAIAVLVMGYFFYSFNVEKEKKVVWTEFQGKAKYDSYFITERFLKAKGLKVNRETTYTSINQFSDFSQYDTIFFSNRGGALSQSQIPILLRWIENGGKIVINARNNFNTDYHEYKNTKETKKGILQTAGIAVSKCRLNKNSKEICPTSCKDSVSSASSKTPNKQGANKLEDVDKNTGDELTIADDDASLINESIDRLLKSDISEKSSSTATFTANGQTISRRWRKSIDEIFAYEGKAKSLWNQPARCSGSLFADFSYGKGHIIVYQEESSRFMTNNYEFSRGILRDQNSTYLYYLLNLETKANNILWFERDSYTTIWTIILRYGFEALLFILLLLIAWAWKNGKRFGPIIITDERETLSLKRHIKAIGDFHVKHDSRHALVASCYEQLDSEVKKAIPIAASLSKDSLAEAIKEKTLLPISRIRTVLERRYPEDDAEFTQLIHTINEIRKRL